MVSVTLGHLEVILNLKGAIMHWAEQMMAEIFL